MALNSSHRHSDPGHSQKGSRLRAADPFGFVVAAAFLHALWNLTAKRVSGNIGVFWLGLGLARLLLSPFALFCSLSGSDPAGLPYLLATALIHAVYFSLLAAAYRHGEVSVVYPLARGIGVSGTCNIPEVTVYQGQKRVVDLLVTAGFAHPGNRARRLFVPVTGVSFGDRSNRRTDPNARVVIQDGRILRAGKRRLCRLRRAKDAP